VLYSVTIKESAVFFLFKLKFIKKINLEAIFKINLTLHKNERKTENMSAGIIIVK
jgi:hypothetical protein